MSTSPIKTTALRKEFVRIKGFNDRTRRVALDALDLEVQEGHIFGFVGPNGAGKTTTIKILVGLSWPTSGQAHIFGHAAGSVKARELLGYCPEIASYHDFMGVRELLEVHADLAGVPSTDRRKRASEALEAVRLQDRATSRIKELSKGMQQRFGIAQALVSEPHLLILDEPTSGLDPLAQKEIKDVILHLKQRGFTIFFSSHKLTEVEHICDHIGIIHLGRMLLYTSMHEFLESSEEGEIHFRAAGKTDVSIRKVKLSSVDETLDALRADGASIVRINPVRRSLEDAFFELVTATGGAPS